MNWSLRSLFFLIFVFVFHLQSYAGEIFSISGSKLQPAISVSLSNDEAAQVKKDIKVAATILSLHFIMDGSPAELAVGSNYMLSGTVLTIQPLQTLAEGNSYEIQYLHDGAVHKEQFTIALPTGSKEPPVVKQVYPIADTVPQNILCFQVRFATSMAPDPLAYQHVSIKDEAGKEITFAWRQKSVWDDNNKLLMLMVHPGRVKSGIHYMGPVFVEGKKFTVTIHKGMKDMYGNELPADVDRTYVIGAEDRNLPRILSVTSLAKQGTQDAIQISFSEGMDRACMTVGLRMYDARQQIVPYTLTDAGDDKTFILTPDNKWKKGKYSILLDRTVSDFAANRMNRPFEVTDVKEMQKDEIEVRRYFDIK